jgi:hypothetical protein
MLKRGHTLPMEPNDLGCSSFVVHISRHLIWRVRGKHFRTLFGSQANEGASFVASGFRIDIIISRT